MCLWGFKIPSCSTWRKTSLIWLEILNFCNRFLGQLLIFPTARAFGLTPWWRPEVWPSSWSSSSSSASLRATSRSSSSTSPEMTTTTLTTNDVSCEEPSAVTILDQTYDLELVQVFYYHDVFPFEALTYSSFKTFTFSHPSYSILSTHRYKAFLGLINKVMPLSVPFIFIWLRCCSALWEKIDKIMLWVITLERGSSGLTEQDRI